MMGTKVDTIQRRACLTKQIRELPMDSIKIMAREESSRDTRLIRHKDQSGTRQFQPSERLRHARE
jgi:hypothetical protein